MPIKFLCEKLVRDKTADRYHADGAVLNYRTLNDIEFARELNKKLLEEATEVVQAKDRRETLSELADVHEVLKTIAEFNGISLEEIEASRLQKVQERGGFSGRMYSSIGIIPDKGRLASIVKQRPEHYLVLQDERLERTLETNTGAWKRFFGELKNDIMLTLPQYVVSVLQIGTTSLHSIPAQPVIDILVAVTSLLDFDLNSHFLMRHGWLARGESGINNRRLFVKYDTHNGKEIAHLHCFEHLDPNVKRFVSFTQTLKENAEIRKNYTSLRQELLDNPETTYADYQNGKRTFIEKTLE